MHSHLEAETAFHAALRGQGLPPGVTAVGDLERRFSVYRNTIAHSLSNALAQRFPAVRRIVGAAFFDAAAGVFVRAHPPESPLLHTYGAAFPQFLAQFPPAVSLSYLPDVARIEVLRGQAYHAADAAAMSPEAFGRAVGTRPDDTILRLHPALHILMSAYPVVSIWQMNQPDAPSVDLVPRAEAALIFRNGTAVNVLPVPDVIARVVTALGDGMPLGDVLARNNPTAITDALSLLLRHGLIVGVNADPKRGSHD